MIDLREVRSVTEFQRNLKEYVGRLKRKRTPLVLTVNGRAELVVQDAASYQKLLDQIEEREAREGIQQGLADVAAGRVTSLEDFEKEFRKKHGISRRPR